jgi:hypothetical protein
MKDELWIMKEDQRSEVHAWCSLIIHNSASAVGLNAGSARLHQEHYKMGMLLTKGAFNWRVSGKSCE